MVHMDPAGFESPEAADLTAQRVLQVRLALLD